MLEPGYAGVRSCSCSQTDEDPGWSWLFVWMKTGRTMPLADRAQEEEELRCFFIQNHSIELTASISWVVSYSWWVLELFLTAPGSREKAAASKRMGRPGGCSCGLDWGWVSLHELCHVPLILRSCQASSSPLLYSRRSTMPVKGKTLFFFFFFFNPASVRLPCDIV